MTQRTKSDALLMHIAGTLILAVPFAALGAALNQSDEPRCTVIEITERATSNDWQDAQLDAQIEARAHGCATIHALRG